MTPGTSPPPDDSTTGLERELAEESPEKVSRYSFRRALWLFAGIPTVWTAYFLGIYFVSEVACRGEPGDEPVSRHWLSTAFLVSSVFTGLAIVALAVWLLRGRRRSDPGQPDQSQPDQVRFAQRVTYGLAWFFVVSLVSLAVPILWLSPC